MKLHRILTSSLLLAALSGSSLMAAGPWLHLHVQEGGEETLNLNVPVSLVSTLLPFFEDKVLNHGHLRRHAVDLGHGELGVAELRLMWEALKSNGSGELANIQTSDNDVRVRLDDQSLIVHAREGETENLHLRVPTRVVDALLSGGGETLDLVAAVEALTALGTTELVEVESNQTRARLWVE